MRTQLCVGAIVLCLVSSCKESDQSSPRPGSSNRDVSGRPLGISFADVPLEGYCEARAQLDCYRLQACQPTKIRSLFNTVAACEFEQERICEGSFTELTTAFLVDEKQVLYSAREMARALSNHSRQHCNSTKITPSMFSAIEPLLSLSQACKQSAFCQSGFCDNDNRQRCGVCREPSPPIGTSCPEQCPFGQRCACQNDDAGTQCACKDALRPYEDCSNDPVACDEGSRCIDGKSENAEPISLCVPFPGQGEACGVSVGLLDCLGEQFCAPSGVCARPKLVGVGAACNTRDLLCPTGYDCRGVCVAKANYDESCTVRNQRTIPDAGPATCREGPCLNRCRGISALGDFCRDARDCQIDYGCYRFSSGRQVCASEAQVRAELTELFLCP